MNKFIFALCAVVCCAGFNSYPYFGAEECADEIFDQLIPAEINLSSIDDYQAVAKSFGYRLFPGCYGNNEGETTICSYHKSDSTGVVFHVGWYSNGFIVTQLNGTNEGFQTIVWDNQIVGVSYPSNREVGIIINGYSWGSIETRMEWQGVYGLNTLEK